MNSLASDTEGYKTYTYIYCAQLQYKSADDKCVSDSDISGKPLLHLYTLNKPQTVLRAALKQRRSKPEHAKSLQKY